MEMKVKKEVIEQDDDDNTEETQFYMEEEEQTEQDDDDVSQYSLSTDSTLDSFPVIEQRKPMEIKQKFVSISKRFSGHAQKTKQVVSDDRWKTTRNKRKRAMNDHLYDPVKVKSPVVKRAEEVQAKLGSKFPSIVRSMLRSNVTSGFWMNFPRRFCNLHLPKHDASVFLVDEKGEEYKTNFLVGKSGLSGGWKAYSTAHNLHEGDALVFQFIRPSECKVYTVRSNELTEVDGALGLLDLAVCKTGFDRKVNIPPELSKPPKEQIQAVWDDPNRTASFLLEYVPEYRGVSCFNKPDINIFQSKDVEVISCSSDSSLLSPELQALFDRVGGQVPSSSGREFTEVEEQFAAADLAFEAAEDMERRSVKSLGELERERKRKRVDRSTKVQAGASKGSDAPVDNPPLSITTDVATVPPSRKGSDDTRDRGTLPKTIAAKTGGPPPAPGAFLSEAGVGSSAGQSSSWAPMLMKWDLAPKRYVPVLCSDSVQNRGVALAISKMALLPKDMEAVQKMDPCLKRDSGCSFALSIQQYLHDMCNNVLVAQNEVKGAYTARDLALTQLNEGRNALAEAKAQVTQLESRIFVSGVELEAVKAKLLATEGVVQSLTTKVEELGLALVASKKELAKHQHLHSTELRALQDQLVKEYNAGILKAQNDMMNELPSYKRAAKEAGWRAALEAAKVDASSTLFQGPPPSPEDDLDSISSPLMESTEDEGGAVQPEQPSAEDVSEKPSSNAVTEARLIASESQTVAEDVTKAL